MRAMTLAARMKQAVERAKESQVSFASAIGVSPQALNAILSGKTRELMAGTALLAAKRGRLSPYWLVFGEGPMDPSELERAGMTGDLASTFARKIDRLNEASRLTIYNLIDHLLGLQGSARAPKRPKARTP